MRKKQKRNEFIDIQNSPFKNFRSIGLDHVISEPCYKGATVKPVLSGHSKRKPKMVFKTNYRLMQVKSILQYCGPSLSYNLPLRSFFCLFLSGCFRQVLLYFTKEL